MNRRQWLAAAALSAISGCTRNKGAGFYGYGLVADAGDNSLTAVDLTTFRLAATIPLGASPSRVLAAPGGNPAQQAFVLTPENGTIHVIDGNLKRTRNLRLADTISRMELSPDGRSLLVVAPREREIIHVGLEPFAALARHKFSVSPNSMDVSVDGLVAVSGAAGTVETVSLTSGQRTKAETGPLGEIRFRADGKLLLAANTQRPSLLALDAPSLKIVAELPLAMQPDHLCFNADQGQLFVSGTGMDGVAVVFPYKILEVEQTLLAGRAPGTMACSESPAYLFVGSESGSSVCILNIATRKPMGFVDMGGKPSFITITPDSSYALVLDQTSGDIGVIHVPAIHSNRLKTGAALYTMISVGNKPVSAAVIRRLG